MADKTDTAIDDQNLNCPECRQPLKRRRTRKADECEMICGGCGAMFDVCDLDTVDELKRNQ